MPVRPPSLRAIAAFEAAARHQSFSKAAEELNLTRSAISHAIRSLEERLGVELFTRQGPSVALTDPGRVFAGRLRLSLEMISEAFDLPARADRAVLRIGGPPELMRHVVAGGVAGLRASRPDVELELRAQAGVADLLAGSIDLLVIEGASPPAGLQARLLARETLVPVAAPGFFGRLPARPQDLAEAPLIHCPSRPWRLWLDAADVAGAPADEGLKVEDLAAAVELARAGVGVCLAPALCVRADLRRRTLLRVSEVEASLPEGYWALWTAASAKAGLIEAFAEQMLASLAAPGDEAAARAA